MLALRPFEGRWMVLRRRPWPALMARRSEAARFGRRLLDATLEHHFGEGRRRTYSGASLRTLDRLFDERLPEHGRDPRSVLSECRRSVFRHSMQMSHPRIFGLFNPAPLPVAAFAELPAAFLNQSVDAWKAAPAATHLETRLIRWMNDLIGYGPRAFGVFTSGGGIANAIALKMARDHAAGLDVRRSGLTMALASRLRVYASEQSHFSIPRSLDLLGLGERALVRVPADRDMKMRTAALAETMARDRKRGLVPMAIVATAGTTNTGNIDPLPAIARIARKERVHLHVDAAYGGALLFSSRFRERLAGLERADSVTIDPHKWLFQPFSLGGLFVRDGRALNASCRTEPDYLKKDLEAEPERLDFYHYSIEGSRPFRGLKLWFTLKTLGRRGLGELVDRTMEVAAHLEKEVARQDCFEAFRAPVELASVCFRYLPPWARRLEAAARSRPRASARLNRVQAAIQQAIEKGGYTWFPAIILDRAVYFRFGVFNYLTTPADVDAVLAHIRRTASVQRIR
jgi:aromatic-L-amino-acid/L-tryptophan decarboxylase